MPTDVDREFGEIALKNELITKKQHEEALKTLKRLKAKIKGKKKKPRLVDVLVQKEFMSGSEAKTVEKARNYRAARREDKLYGRIALKSKFCKSKHVDKGLTTQKDSYLEGKDPTRLADFLLKKNYITEEEDEAIQAAMGKLDVVEYMAGRKPKSKRAAAASASDDDDLDVEDEEDLEEFDDEELEELDDDLELDLDADDDATSLDDEEDAKEIDSQIESALSGFDDLDVDDDADEPVEADSPPHGLSDDDDDDDDDDLGSDDDGEDLDIDMDEDDDDDDDLGSDDLGDEDDDDDLDVDLDDDDSDLD